MIRILGLFTLLATLILFPACNPSLQSFLTPQSVVVGEVFDVTIDVTYSGGIPNGNPNGAAAVVQLPPGLVVVDASSCNMTNPVRDDPAVLGLFTAEPGHQLASFSGVSSFTATTDQLILRLRATQRGSIELKLAFAFLVQGGPWTVGQPQQADFSLINGGSFGRTIIVEDVPLLGSSVWRDMAADLPVPLEIGARGRATADIA